MLRKDRFDEREADFYEALYTQSQAQFDAYVQTSTVLNNYAHVFSLLVRLRQVPHPPPPLKSRASIPTNAEQIGLFPLWVKCPEAIRCSVPYPCHF